MSENHLFIELVGSGALICIHYDNNDVVKTNYIDRTTKPGYRKLSYGPNNDVFGISFINQGYDKVIATFNGKSYDITNDTDEPSVGFNFWSGARTFRPNGDQGTNGFGMIGVLLVENIWNLDS
ncbi:hypothetical protein BGZ59_003067 [Podila verticillata]|nr:hypothetical protein BGZ59_003067 [Podila verticillata]